MSGTADLKAQLASVDQDIEVTIQLLEVARQNVDDIVLTLGIVTRDTQSAIMSYTQNDSNEAKFSIERSITQLKRSLSGVREYYRGL